MNEFIEFPKIARLSRDCLVTEKIDGTNASVFIGEDGAFLVGSRSRWITPGDDNFGFAQWAGFHKAELMTLGPGHHFGEWWGSGIQRGYGLPPGEKRFSLFNVLRWCLHGETPIQTSSTKNDPKGITMQKVLPPCVGLVPMLYRGLFDTLQIEIVLKKLQIDGSWAAPGFMKPEGVVVYHLAGKVGFKQTIEKDEQWKGK